MLINSPTRETDQGKIMRIFIGGLRETVKEQDIRKLLAPFGPVHSVDMRYSEPGQGLCIHRGFAYVEAELTPEAWKRCRNTYSKTKWFGSPKLILEAAKERPMAVSPQEEKKVKKEKRARHLVRHNLRSPINFSDSGCPQRIHTHFSAEVQDLSEASCSETDNSLSEPETSNSETSTSVTSMPASSCEEGLPIEEEFKPGFTIDIDAYFKQAAARQPMPTLPDKAAWLAARSEFRRDFKGQIKAAKRKSRLFVK